jgi:excisionase family DNA binding protein
MKYLTTGQAAKFLMVTRDTVLKWIKQGKLPAVRTAGGHFRVSSDSLKIPASATPETEQIPATRSDQPEYCWEYFASGKKIKDECRSCLVYKMRGTKCYEAGEFLKELGFGATCCPTSCTECPYYKEQVRQKIKLLVFTTDSTLENELVEQAKASRLDLQVTSWEYDCAFIIGSFEPEFVIVDCPEEGEIDKYKLLCDHIMHDPRVHLKLFLAVSQNKKNSDFAQDFTVITRPFTITEAENHLRKLERRQAKQNWNSMLQQKNKRAANL